MLQVDQHLTKVLVLGRDTYVVTDISMGNIHNAYISIKAHFIICLL